MTTVVLLSRDFNIVEHSTRSVNHPEKNVKLKLDQVLSRISRKMRVRFFSYETLFMWGHYYVENWLSQEGPDLAIDPIWLQNIRNENKKYLRQEIVATS